MMRDTTSQTARNDSRERYVLNSKYCLQYQNEDRTQVLLRKPSSFDRGSKTNFQVSKITEAEGPATVGNLDLLGGSL